MILLRKRLLLDTDAGELARVKQVLDRNQVEYDVKTTVSDNSLSRTFSAKAAAHVNTTYSAMASQAYVYQLYVKARDYSRARQLAWGE